MKINTRRLLQNNNKQQQWEKAAFVLTNNITMDFSSGVES